MANIHTPVTADVSRINAPIRIRCKQGDVHSRYLNVTIVDFGVPVDLSAWDTAIINAEREDGESDAFECTISGNQVIAPIAAWMLLNAGWVRTSISVFSSGEVKLTTQTIMLQVEAAEYLGDDIDEDENYSILVDLINDVQDIVDVTLSISNKAADSKTVGDRFRGLEAATGIQPCVFGEFDNGYFSTAAVGGTMTLTRTSNAGFTSAILSVSAGDIVTITATGTGTASSTGATVYAITDSSKVVLDVGAQNAALADAALKMPANAAYIVVNNRTADQANPSLVKGAKDQVAGIVKRVDSGLELAHRRLDSIWAYGRINGSTGIYTTASGKRRRTISPCGVTEGIFTADAQNTGYSFYVFAYRRFGTAAYIGAWDDTNQTWVQGASGFSTVKYFDFSAHPEYKFQLVLLRDDDDYIRASDTIDVYFDMSPVNSNVAKINEHERMLGDIAQPAVVNAVTTHHIVPSGGSTSRITMLANAHIKSESLSYSEFGTIANTSASDAVYYVQVTEDSVLYVETDHSDCTCRTSAEEPTKSTSAVWTGRISRTMPTPKAPWVVPANYYIAVCAEGGLATGESIDICVAPIGYSLSAAVMDAVRDMMGGADYYPGENMERTSDVYAALDALEAVSGNRMTHTAISDNIDDNTPIRAYVINTSPKRLDTNYATQPEPFFDKPKFLITGCIHGNERGTALFLISFCKNLLSNPEYAYIAGQFEWHIIPVVNVWGFNHTMLDSNNNIVWYKTNQTVTIVSNTPTLRGGVRNNVDDININRDFDDVSGFQTNEAKAVKAYFDGSQFACAIDFHQWWSDTYRTIIGFSSLPPFDGTEGANASKYRRAWCEMAAGGKEAEDYIRNTVDDRYTQYQMAFMWGDSETVTSTAAAYNYFGKKCIFASTMESSMLTKFLTKSTTPYQPLALIAGNVFTQRMIAAVARATLNEI